MLAKTFNYLTTFLLVFFIGFSATAQRETTKDNNPTTKVERDDELLRLTATGNEPKGGSATISYTVMQNILQSKKLEQVDFDVKVDRIQSVLVEVFNEEGELIEVIFNDFMAPNKAYNFKINGSKWTEDTHYLRVTTEDYVENHQIGFKP